ncbi:glycosyltransferase [Microbacterium sp. bgisy189]|uniref:glycosyltransferase n=1 Tax=Microbacterium sp. bgisy189 TaxID=3413798 RepID=UPI003EC113CD
MSAVNIVLIPAYEPNARLVALVQMLPVPVLVVDDGSGERFATVFADAEAAGAVVVRHPVNRGKGAALRTGFAESARRWPGADIVTADADGQHTPADIAKVAAALAAQSTGCSDEERVIVLGARGFVGDVPARSRIGNTVTRWMFRAVTGTGLQDTQTGLRAFPASVVPWLQSLPGDRFEYEFTMLLRARAAGIRLIEVPIETVYLEGNVSSHFRPLVDSVRIYAPLLRFSLSALLAFAIDTIALLVIHALTGWLLLSVVAARLLSASVNFTVNRGVVFRSGRDVPVRTAAIRYASLAVLIMTASFGMLTALLDIGIATLPAKILTDATLFLVSFSVQRAVVFAPRERPIERAHTGMNTRVESLS